ncbi:MAG: SDR family oxidoreductase, partial [Chloroflexi bacterium]|nr:SDR family oxidoreductase [Chloroflexota bacterium]
LRLLVTGASGYIGSVLVRRAPQGWVVGGTRLSHPLVPADAMGFLLDVRDQPAVERVLLSFKPDVIIHTAALMRGPDMSGVNVEGSRHVAAAAASENVRLVHLSSDVIFDGEHAPYSEGDPPVPITPYAATKTLAEQAVAEGHPAALIVRTSLVYGFNPLDPRTRAVLAGSMPWLFTDEYRCPIFVDDLADALLELAGSGLTGILHVAGPQSLNRYDFGLKLVEAFHTTPRFRPALSSSSTEPRPRDCTLNTSLARRVLTTELRSVDQVLAQIT